MLTGQIQESLEASTNRKIMSRTNSFRLLFFVNKSKINAEGTAPILLRITIGGRKTASTVHHRIRPKEWDSKRGMPFPRGKNEQLITYLETIKHRAMDAHNELLMDNEVVTPEMVRDVLFGFHTSSGQQMLLRMWEEHNDRLKGVIDKECSYTLWRKHNTTRNYFKEFLDSKMRMQDIHVKLLRLDVVERFYSYLRHELGLSHNTCIKHMQMMKKIVIRAQKNGWLRMDPFDGFSMRMQERRRSFLTPEELAAIENHEFTIPRMQMVRDLFLFSCYTGFAYIDVAHLTRGNMDRTPDGLWWLRKPRQKTKLNSQVPILKPAMEIIERYANIKRMTAEARLFQVISNQKLNTYLKELADVCGIEKNLTFHVTRHTFATTVILQNGVSVEALSRMMGHRDIKTTQHYARIVDRKLADEMRGMTNRTNLELAS